MADRCFDHRTRCCRKCEPDFPESVFPAKAGAANVALDDVEPTTEQEFLGNKTLDVADFGVLWGVTP